MENLHTEKSALRNSYGCHGMNGLDTVLQLGTLLHDKLQMKDENSGTSETDEDGSSGLEDEHISTSCSHLNSGTFSASLKANELQSRLEDCKHQSQPVPISSSGKLISAVKGSREKEGVPQQKMGVSWAPDVYDPPPTSITHFPKKRSQQYSKPHKKHGKGKQKGKSIPKEKKHHRKTSGRRSYQGLESFVESVRVHDFKSSLEYDFGDAGIDSIPDPNCGSKFLGQPSGTMHCVY